MFPEKNYADMLIRFCTATRYSPILLSGFVCSPIIPILTLPSLIDDLNDVLSSNLTFEALRPVVPRTIPHLGVVELATSSSNVNQGQSQQLPRN